MRNGHYFLFVSVVKAIVSIVVKHNPPFSLITDDADDIFCFFICVICVICGFSICIEVHALYACAIAGVSQRIAFTHSA